MNTKYDALLKKAREEDISHYYQQVLKVILEDKALENQAFIHSVITESLHTLLTKDQKKSMTALAKSLITDKAVLKEITEKIKAAP